jgi:hypothetical protein
MATRTPLLARHGKAAALARHLTGLRIAQFALLATAGGCDRAPPEPAPATAPAAAPLVTAANPAAPPGTRAPAGANPCTTMCRHSIERHCAAAADCVSQCEDAWNGDVCRDTMRRSLSCFAAQSADAWECDDDGLPSLKDGHCDAEQTAHAECMGAQP